MLIRTRRPSDASEQEITPEALYLDRRKFITGAAAVAASFAFPDLSALAAPPPLPSLGRLGRSRFDSTETRTPYEDVTGYNNFYEFGVDKDDPARNAGRLRTRPWTITIDGEVEKPQTFDMDDLFKLPLEERVYRMRCVEGWSMVIPWAGFPLKTLLDRVAPKSQARFVMFETLYDPKQMPGQKKSVLKWPYREGLRLDEAYNPLTLLAVGLYGRRLPNQNGAPIRLVVPWKYGFKGIKSITRISLTSRQPQTTWNLMAANEYGFYANVNPGVDHPRWSQAKERRIGEFRRRDTLMFNGYADEVAHLYKGMDLRRYY